MERKVGEVFDTMVKNMLLNTGINVMDVRSSQQWIVGVTVILMLLDIVPFTEEKIGMMLFL